MAKLKSLRVMLQSMLAQFSQISTDKGILSWSSDSEFPEVGDTVVIIEEDGTERKPEDGEYRTEEGKIIVVEDGKVTEVKDIEESPESEEPAEENQPEENPDEDNQSEQEQAREDEPQEEENPDNQGDENEPEAPAAEEPEAEDKDERIKNLEAEVARLEEENGMLKERIAELENKPAAEPAEEAFNRVNKIEKTGDKKIDRLIDIVNAK